MRRLWYRVGYAPASKTLAYSTACNEYERILGQAQAAPKRGSFTTPISNTKVGIRSELRVAMLFQDPIFYS